MRELIEILANLMKKNFWGEVTIIFKEGRPVLLKKNQQIKID